MNPPKSGEVWLVDLGLAVNQLALGAYLTA
ncbi:hypothetical protein SAMD00079811_03410 [Scytonema sp. HK-05]|nr:hypothetical protein SAMD00079811_03410 [Scytonema sp. HK-05]